MKILVIGSSGREHAIIYKLLKQNENLKIYCAPGNGGISKLAECIDIKTTEIDKLVKFAKENSVEMTIVGNEDPLILGIVDKFEQENLRIFGPKKNAAVLEGSKAFSKELMKRYNIPTAKYEIFDDFDKALKYVEQQNYPIVIKADGLAMGKGVTVCNNFKECEQALIEVMKEKKFSSSGDKVVIEEFLQGEEVSILAFCDGETIKPMVSAKDHKRALDGDLGSNTGGMGSISPSRSYTKEISEKAMDKIYLKTVEAMNKEGRNFKGIIFFGLILTKDGPKVIEYNVRFGDPETQSVLLRLKTNLLDIFNACVDGDLDKINIEWYDNSACCIILASGGYPEDYMTGYLIDGLQNFYDNENIIIFHSGTKFENNQFFTKGGRVLGVTSLADNLDDALKNSYEAVEKIKFKNMFFRKDIGI